ncbi:MAG TPA: CvpA family protein [Chitinophagaceae bacterium]|nr:CvpA family protein [Chitinophagaceae bacterium]
MIIDLIYAVILVIAIFKGIRRGFIIAIFSVLAFIIGLAAAMKLSTVVAGYLENSTNISSKWLPFLSFLIVFILVVLLVRMVAKMIEKSVEFALLGWVNRLLGIALYIALYTTIFSILLFYAVQMHVIKPETILASRTYNFIEPWGPYAINGLGAVIPWFRDMFRQLEEFFGGVSQKVSA